MSGSGPRSGRAGSIFDLGDGQVRKVAPGSDLAHEAMAMSYAARYGFPVPDLVSYSSDEIVMEKIEGVTLADDLTLHPWRLRAHARTLAELHKRLHQVPPPDWLKHGSDGDCLLHLDLHIENVMISSKGPVVIDWANAAAGPGAMDVALTWVIMSTSVSDGASLRRFLTVAGSRRFISVFLAPFDQDEIKAQLPAAALYRKSDRNIRPDEVRRIERMVEALIGQGSIE